MKNILSYKLFEDLESMGDSVKRDYEKILYHEYIEKTARGHYFNINIVNKVDELLSSSWQAYKSVEHASSPSGEKVRMDRNLNGEFCMTYFTKQSKILGRWFNRSSKYHYRGVDYTLLDYDKKKIDTIEIRSRATIRIKTDDDDWFYVEVTSHFNEFTGRLGGRCLVYTEVFYKCDQWRGLMELLNDLNFIIKK
jgi:hypothetical protein